MIDTSAIRCCGCGKAAQGHIKPCDCATMVGSRDKEGGGWEYIVFTSQTQARRLDLSELIKTRVIGTLPNDRDVTLDDEDWFEIIAALEGDRP